MSGNLKHIKIRVSEAIPDQCCLIVGSRNLDGSYSAVLIDTDTKKTMPFNFQPASVPPCEPEPKKEE